MSSRQGGPRGTRRIAVAERERLQRALAEAREQQTATAEILKLISASTFDLQLVLATVIERATRLCGATRGHIFRFDGEYLRFAAAYGARSEFTDFLAQNPVRADRGSVAGQAAVLGRTVHVPDVLAEPDYQYGDLQRLQDYRTVLAVPMLRDGVLLGVITILKSEVHPFTDEQIAWVTTFADQAVIAIENIRLVHELQARTQALARSVKELTVLGEIGRAVSSTLDLETVFDTILARAVELSGAIGGVMYEYDEAAGQFGVRGAHHADDELIAVLRASPVRLGEGAIGVAAVRRAPVQVTDVLDEREYAVSRIREVFARLGYRFIVAVPLLIEERAIGGLVVWREEPGRLAPEVVTLLQAFATQSALAMQNARLFQEVAAKGEQLHAASRHKSEFLANMSHELRTPLNAIIGFSEVLLERMFGELNAKQAEYLEDILGSGRHLLSLINEILDLSKIEAGRLELTPAPFDLRVTLEAALTFIRERAARQGIAVDLEIGPQVGDIVGDERKIKQVVLNLLSNAVKFTPSGGRIRLRASPSDGAVVVSVSDTGIGIAAADREAVFEEFRQVGSDDARRREGTGLGLTLARKFVELHGGRIWVDSVDGAGSTFTFTLPAPLDAQAP